MRLLTYLIYVMIFSKRVVLMEYSEFTTEGLAYVDNPVESEFPGHWLPISIIKRIMEMRARTTNAYENFKTTTKSLKKTLLFASNKTVHNKVLVGKITKTTANIDIITYNTTDRSYDSTKHATMEPTRASVYQTVKENRISPSNLISVEDTVKSTESSKYLETGQDESMTLYASTKEEKTSPTTKSTTRMKEVDSTISQVSENLNIPDTSTGIEKTTEKIPETTKIKEIPDSTTQAVEVVSSTTHTPLVSILSSTLKDKVTTNTPLLEISSSTVKTTIEATVTTVLTTTTSTTTTTTTEKSTTETGNPFY